MLQSSIRFGVYLADSWCFVRPGSRVVLGKDEQVP